MSEETPEQPQYLRRVTFLDLTPDDGSSAPVHVASQVLLDGVDHTEALARVDGMFDGGWTVTGCPGTVISLIVYAEHATLKSYPSKTVPGEMALSGTHLCGIPVLTPSDYEWERLPIGDGEPELVRVFFFAREVEIIAVKAPAEVSI